MGATLYVTTFPCHQCTRQVIASGVRRLVYIYPYPKSLAARFHGDDIYIDTEGPATKVPFRPFLGVAPRRYLRVFTMGKRKNEDGTVVRVDDVNRSPRLMDEDPIGEWDASAYIFREVNALQKSKELFDAANAPATAKPSDEEKH
jgi:hypothetical protein